MLRSKKELHLFKFTFNSIGILVTLLCLFSSGAIAQDDKWQNKYVSGKLVDSLGRPIQGASIFTDGNITSAKTDVEGEFRVAYPLNHQIRAAHVAYVPLVI